MLAERGGGGNWGDGNGMMMDGGGMGFGTGPITAEEEEAWERQIASHDQTPDYSLPVYD